MSISTQAIHNVDKFLYDRAPNIAGSSWENRMISVRRFILTATLATGLAIAPAMIASAFAGNNESTGEAIESFIKSGQISLGTRLNDERLFQIFTFYESRNFKPIWTRDNGVKTKAKEFLKALKRSYEHGLKPGDYSIKDIEERMTSQNPEVLAELDLLMSHTFADFAHHLSQGRVRPNRANRNVAIRPTGRGPLTLIDGAEAADDIGPYLDTLKPQTPRYDRLKSKLAVYRQIAAKGGWPRVPTGKTLEPGDRDQRVLAIRRLLLATGDLKRSAGGITYDPDVVEAVKRFQARHGRHPDGVIGPSTLKAMNVPIKERIRQMVVNLERRRWMPNNLGRFYVFVNQADQYLKVVRKGKTIHTALLVVGKPYHQTPVFSDRMEYIVINPYWNVPKSIANKEYLPKLRRDPGALLRQNIRLISSGGREVDPYSVNWSSVSRVPYLLRQDSGDRNALGRIKFMFPNRYAVYIHDTPSKKLFAREQRYFSHGCMRVQNPVDLGEVLMRSQGWTKAKINAQIATNQRRIVRLKRHIPVHVTYLTAWVNKDGSVHFRDDVYGRDKRLAAVLRQ